MNRAPGGGPHDDRRHLNVLLVTLDTVRADRIGAYGYARAATPVLDRLARAGARFSQATSPSPLTAPAHAALLTGMYPARFAILDNAARPLPEDATTLAELLGAAGYSTGAAVGAFILDRAYGFAQGFDYFDANLGPVRSGMELEAERPAGRVLESALAWLQRRDWREPLFLWVHFYDAHTPYDPPAPFRANFAQRLYDGEVAYVDHVVGRLLDALDGRGLTDRTIVVVIGDHGEGLGDHGEDEHGLLLYEEVLRVPWIVKWPGGPSGIEVPEPVRSVDLVPTVLQLAGLTPPSGLDGESLVAVMRGSPRRDPPPAYAESRYGQLHFGWSALRSLRVDRWKVIDAPQPELYDLDSDPREQQNVVSSRPGLAARMAQEAQQLATAGAGPTTPHRPSPETLERLRSLGYVGIAATPISAGRGPNPKEMLGIFKQYRLLLNEAITDLRAGRAATAETKFRKLVAMNERAYDVHLFLGDACLAQRKYDEALGEYETASVLLPTAATPFVAAAHVLAVQRRPHAALRKLDEAARLEPASFEVAIARGRVLEDLGRDPEAFDQYERAIAANGANPRARASLGFVAIRLKRLDVAEAQFHTLLDMEFDLARVRFGLGRVAEIRGDRAAAAREYREALRIDPGLAAAQEALARVAAAPRQ